MFVKRIFKNGSIELLYYVGPENGPPLVLLHGVSSSWSAFSMMIPFLSPHYTIYAVNLRGHGGSTHAEGYGCDDYVSDIAPLLSECFAEPVSIIGHSLGALVAMKTASEYRERCKSIVLLDPPLESTATDNPDRHTMFTRWRDSAARSSDSREILDIFGANNTSILRRACTLSVLDPNTLSQVLDKSLFDTFSYQDVAKRIQCPVLLCHGEPDLGSVTTEEQVKYMVNHVRLCIVQKVNGPHGIHWNQPVEVSAHILPFLEFVYWSK